MVSRGNLTSAISYLVVRSTAPQCSDHLLEACLLCGQHIVGCFAGNATAIKPCINKISIFRYAKNKNQKSENTKIFRRWWLYVLRHLFDLCVHRLCSKLTEFSDAGQNL